MNATITNSTVASNHQINNPAISSEWQCLVNLLQLALLQKSPSEIGLNLRELENIDWERLFYLAHLHRVRPLLYASVRRWEITDAIPNAALMTMKKWQLHLTRNNLNYANELKELVQLFRRSGVEIIPYKGVILAIEGYGTLGNREGSDIDFLFPIAQFDTVVKVVQTRGYEADWPIPTFFRSRFFERNCEYSLTLEKGNFKSSSIDMHWKIATKYLQIELNYQDILPFTTPKKLFGVTINTLTPEGLVLTTCLHHAGKEQFKSLKYVCDIAAILNQFGDNLNWDLILETAQKWKVKNLIIFSLGVTKQFFQIPLPEEVARNVAAKSMQQHLLKYGAVNEEETATKVIWKSYFKTMWFHISLREHLSTKVKVLYHFMCYLFLPKLHDLKGKEMSKLNYWLLFLSKPFRLWKTYTKVL